MNRTKPLNDRIGKECNKIDCVSWHVAGSIFGSDVNFCKECKWAYNSQYQKDLDREEIKREVLWERQFLKTNKSHHR